jgi:hypothetical protein
MDKVGRKKKVVSILVIWGFLLLLLLTFEDRMDRLSQNISKELPLCAAQYPRRTLISHYDLVMQALHGPVQ